MWVIYENPRDFPGKWVVRRWVGLAPDKDAAAVADSLESARSAVPGIAFRDRIERMPGDDPAIVEVWL